MSQNDLRHRQHKALLRRCESSARYLHTVEQLLTEHPGDTFYTNEVEKQRAFVAQLKRALDYTS